MDYSSIGPRVDFQMQNQFSLRSDVGRFNFAFQASIGIVLSVLQAIVDETNPLAGKLPALTGTLALYSETLSQGRLAELVDAIQTLNINAINQFLTEAQEWAGNNPPGIPAPSPFGNDMISGEFDLEDFDPDPASFSDAVSTMEQQEASGRSSFTINMVGGPQPIGMLQMDNPVSTLGVNSTFSGASSFSGAAASLADMGTGGIFGTPPSVPASDPNEEASPDT